MGTKALRRVAVLTAGLMAALSLTSPAFADVVPSLSGRITDRQTGAPLAGACVTVLRDSDGSQQASVCTTGAGQYEIAALPADNYKVRVQASGYAEQWAYGAPDRLNAQSLWLSGDFTKQLDFPLWPGAGEIGGQITDENGAPARATVGMDRTDGQYWHAIVYTDDAGHYQMANIPAGPYRVSIEDNKHGIQWAYGQESPETAEIFQVTDGGATVVDERYLPLATVSVTVTDAVTQRPVSGACAQINAGPQPRACSGANGVVSITGVQPGSWIVDAYDPSGRHSNSQVNLAVTRSGPNDVAVALQPTASIITAVRDASTKKPVGVCFHTVAPDQHGQSAHMTQYCSDPTTGRLVVGQLPAGTFQLYGIPTDDTHGALWVTGHGSGTGDQRQALAITTRIGRATYVPPVDVGAAGTVSGVVRDRTTDGPVPHVCAYPFAFNAAQGGTFGHECSNASGQYTISGLGPYDWPIEFTSAPIYGVSWQWSGDVADRFGATPVHVTAGATAILDAHVTAGGTLPGSVADRAGNAQFGYVWVYNARTGDPATSSYNTDSTPLGSFTVKGLATQTVRIEYYVSGDSNCWYRDQRGFATATEVPVTAGIAAPPITLVDCNS
jgi:hypothetical protein